MLYFSINHSQLQYGIILWGLTYDYIIKEIETRQNDIIHKQLEILKLHDLYKLEIGKFTNLCFN